MNQIAERDGWRMCRSATCEVVYFRGTDAVAAAETGTTPFHKSSDPNRLVCFCFEHSVADLEADLRLNGESTIRPAIKAACKAGQDDCEHKNPQGRCCLGNVGTVLKGATRVGTQDADLEGCCGVATTEAASSAPEPQISLVAPALEEPVARSSLLAAAGALVAAVLSSACCWLPLVAIVGGVSTAGLGSFFEQWRTPFLAATLAMLGAGFYLAYRTPRCLPGNACANPQRRVQRLNRGLLWASAVLAAAFVLFPEYVSAFTGDGGDLGTVVPSQTIVRYDIDGMTCAGCEAHVRDAIGALPGVDSVAVSYADGSAEVAWSSEPDDASVSAAIREFGYRATSHGGGGVAAE